MAQHIQCSWDGFIAIHRYEDLALIRSVVRERQPAFTVELGTAAGGFAAFLAATVVEWGGQVLTVDKVLDLDRCYQLRALYDNLVCIGADVLAEPVPEVVSLLCQSGALLYCDNGHKQRELELYAPLLGPDALVGTHDYGTEVDPTWAEPFMAALGYAPYRHAEFAALAHPDYYPTSLTRFWVRD